VPVLAITSRGAVRYPSGFRQDPFPPKYRQAPERTRQPGSAVHDSKATHHRRGVRLAVGLRLPFCWENGSSGAQACLFRSRPVRVQGPVTLPFAFHSPTWVRLRLAPSVETHLEISAGQGAIGRAPGGHGLALPSACAACLFVCSAIPEPAGWSRLEFIGPCSGAPPRRHGEGFMEGDAGA